MDCADLVTTIAASGLTGDKPSGVLARLGHLFSEDKEHRVSSAVNASGRVAGLVV